jgi:hypothetical protein
VSWSWLALVDERPADATAAAEVSCGGWLAAWHQRRKPVRTALRADARIVDPGGRAACASLVIPPPGVHLLFDDPAVQEARRRVLAMPPLDAVSSLLRDASHFEGAITVARGADARARLRDDPFARIFPARLLDVGPGLFARVPWPAGPVIERYGSDKPWPADRFV